MKIIVCVDDNNGIMFNKRRQSRDSVLIQDIVACLNSGNLLIDPYSEKLFSNSDVDAFFISEEFLSEAESDDYCFVENHSLAEHASRIDELIIYRWNRNYPADTYLDIEPVALGMKLVSTTEFVGSSHDKITKELYSK